MSRQSHLHATSPDGEVSIRTITSDAPALPIAQLDDLRRIALERVDWVFAETEREASFRRHEVLRANTFKFFERIATLVVALVAVLCGIAAAACCAHIGQTAVAVTFATTTIGALAYGFISATKGVTEQPRQTKRSR